MVSVIITTYNREQTIEKAVRSILNQTYRDIELIVVDDGSADDTESIMQRIDDQRLKYFRYSTNQGRCRALNYGLEKATGDFITFHDSDDVCYPTKIEKQWNYLTNSSADAVICQMNRYLESDLSFISVFPANIEHEGILTQKEIVSGSKVSPQCLMIKKEIAHDCKFDEDLKRLVDWDYSISISQYYKIAFMKEVLVDVYMREDSITMSDVFNDNRIQALWKMLIEKYQDIWPKYPKEYLSNLYNLRRYLIKRNGISNMLVERKIYQYNKSIKQIVYLGLTFTKAIKIYYLFRGDK